MHPGSAIIREIAATAVNIRNFTLVCVKSLFIVQALFAHPILSTLYFIYMFTLSLLCRRSDVRLTVVFAAEGEYVHGLFYADVLRPLYLDPH